MNEFKEEKELLEEFADEIIYNPYNRPLYLEEILPLLEGVGGYIAGRIHYGRGHRKSACKLEGDLTVRSRI